MTARFQQISGLDRLAETLERSQAETVVLFNHDPWCPISARAYDQVSSVALDVVLIDVSRERIVTRELAQRTGVRHESPQVIVLRDGQVIWSASHHRITREALEQAANGSVTNE
jgi:bacillithiol system protein YtxJ